MADESGVFWPRLIALVRSDRRVTPVPQCAAERLDAPELFLATGR